MFQVKQPKLFLEIYPECMHFQDHCSQDSLMCPDCALQCSALNRRPDLMRQRAAGPQHRVFNHRPLLTTLNLCYCLLLSIVIYAEEQFIYTQSRTVTNVGICIRTYINWQFICFDKSLRCYSRNMIKKSPQNMIYDVCL